jgi:hypothetical protein
MEGRQEEKEKERARVRERERERERLRDHACYKGTNSIPRALPL